MGVGVGGSGSGSPNQPLKSSSQIMTHMYTLQHHWPTPYLHKVLCLFMQSSVLEHQVEGLFAMCWQLLLTHSRAFVASLPASSYAERINSAAGTVCTKGNVLLNTDHISHLVPLRMNKEFFGILCNELLAHEISWACQDLLSCWIDGRTWIIVGLNIVQFLSDLGIFSAVIRFCVHFL